jgi:hypothetical protein
MVQGGARAKIAVVEGRLGRLALDWAKVGQLLAPSVGKVDRGGWGGDTTAYQGT